MGRIVMLVYFALVSLAGCHPIQDLGVDQERSWLLHTDNETLTDLPSIRNIDTSLSEMKHNYTDLATRFEEYIRNTTSLMGTLQRQIANIQSKTTTQVAFSAIVSDNLHHISIGTKIPFGFVVYQSGTAYDKRTGIFTAPVNGVYLFSLFCHAIDANTLVLTAKVDGSPRTYCVSQPANDDTGGNMFVFHLTTGQKVWVETFGTSDTSIYRQFTSFSGVLIQGD